jgi:hypothetical protein
MNKKNMEKYKFYPDADFGAKISDRSPQQERAKEIWDKVVKRINARIFWLKDMNFLVLDLED